MAGMAEHTRSMIIGTGPGFLKGALAVVFAIMLAFAPAALAEDSPRVFGAEDNMSAPAANVETPPRGTPKPAYMLEDQPLQLRDYDEPQPAAPEPWWSQLLGFLLKLVIVLALVFVSLVALKKIQGGKLQLPNAKGRNMVVMETTTLGPNQAMHLVSVGGERLLVVGATPTGLSTLTEITDPNIVRTFLQERRSGAANSAFNQVFDLETVVQEAGSDLFHEALREQKRKKGWPDR